MNSSTKFLIIIITAIVSFLIFENDTDQKVNLLKQKSELGSKDNPIKRAEYEYRMLVNPATGKIPQNIRAKEVEFVKSILSVKEQRLSKGQNVQALDFQSRGPVNRGGRVRALGIDIRSTASNSVIIAAGVSGGIWRSTNNGSSWIQTSLPSQINGATCIAQDTRSGYQDTWYVGTGEAYGNTARGGGDSYLGNGIFKSSNNGLSWELLPSTSSNTPQSFDSAFDLIHNIAVNPSTGTIYVAAINTIVSSKDGGNTWQPELSSPQSSTFSDVITTSSGKVYATINSSSSDKGIWRKVTDASSWSNVTPSGFPSVYNRVVIAVAPSNENRVYILAHTPGFGKDDNSFWSSNDGGISWTNYSNNLPDTKEPVAGYSAQGSYNMVIAVKPDDPSFVVFGGTNLHRSTNGMTSKLANSSTNWIGGYSVANNINQYPNHHPDQHALVFAPYNSSILYSGDDGGVHATNNISVNPIFWIDKNNGFITSQFYSIAMDQLATDDILIGGLQDNGNYFVNSANTNTPWVQLPFGGDGAFTAIANGKSYYYIETQNGNIIRLKLDNNGVNTEWTVVQPNHSTDYLFINPYTLDPNNSNMMYYIAGDSLWRNSDLSGIPESSSNPTNVNWTVLSNTRTGNIITAVSVSKTPANVVYYGTSDGQIYRLNNANIGNPSPTNIWSGKGLPNAYVSSLAIDPNNANNVLAVFSNYEVVSLYYTSNGGSSWTAVAGNLEENSDGSGNGPSCRWASITNFGGTTTYFVATSTGLYSVNSLNGMSTNWNHESPDEIGVSVCTMVKTREVDGNVLVATHGSGIYSSKLPSNTEDVEFLSENFDSGTFPPAGWSQAITTSDKTWQLGNIDGNNFSSIDPTNIYSAICPWKAADQDETLYSPTLNFPQGDIALNFYVGHSTNWLPDATIELHISTDSGTNWIQIWKAENDGFSWRWREVNIDLSNYSNNNNVNLAWRYVGNDGDNIAIDNVKITGQVVGIEDEIIPPTEFELSQNYPNPFNPTTTINYSIQKSGFVTLKVYNIRGEVVSELVKENKILGNYSINFNASHLASGTYIYELTSGGSRIAKKMLLIK
jgi:Secretion system C-terminal sorting domain